MCHPLVDLDNDGDHDLMIGIGGDNVIVYGYENTGKASSPAWSAKSSWNSPSMGAAISHSTPTLADLDADGDYDLMIGDGVNTGITYAFENTGSPSSPSWSYKSAWNAPSIGSYMLASPALADLDNDGDYDLLIGKNDGISYGYENTGNIYSPIWTDRDSWDAPNQGWVNKPWLCWCSGSACSPTLILTRMHASVTNVVARATAPPRESPTSTGRITPLSDPIQKAHMLQVMEEAARP